MSSLAIAFTGDKRSLKKDAVSSASARFAVKIDDRGRVYLPVRVRYAADSFSFDVNLAKRKIFLSAKGRYRVDSKGRLFLPADIRRSLGLGSGDVLELIFSVSGVSIEMRCSE